MRMAYGGIGYRGGAPRGATMASRNVTLFLRSSAVMPNSAMPSCQPRGAESASPSWLIRPRSDGGCDYVSFSPTPGAVVEVREGSHLPPQMPLLKRRLRLALDEAEACRQHLQQEAGFQQSEPLF